MIKKLPAAYPPSGQQLLLFGAPLNEAPRDVLLEVIEWQMVKERPKSADNVEHEKNLRHNVISQMSRLRTAHRAL
jgi:hypothetical protein